MNATTRSFVRRTNYYIQPADHKTNNLLKTALPEKTPKRYVEETTDALDSSLFDLYLVSWADVEIFMSIAYATFNIFSRKTDETIPRFKMRKNKTIEERNAHAQKPDQANLSLVKKSKLPQKTEPKTDIVAARPKKSFPENEKLSQENARRLKQRGPPACVPLKVVFPKKKKEESLKNAPLEQILVPHKKWATYVIVPHNDSSQKITVRHIRKALADMSEKTQSIGETLFLGDSHLDFVWEATGDALFRLWRYARENMLIHFTVFRTSKDGIFSNFEKMFHYPKEQMGNNNGILLPYRKNNA